MKHTNSNHNSKSLSSNARKGKKRVLVGYRLVPMRADQVDDVARMEGRTVRDSKDRCPWCFLKGGTQGNHGCRPRTEANKHSPPDGGPILKLPLYEWGSE